jgi:hypothetical protein
MKKCYTLKIHFCENPCFEPVTLRYQGRLATVYPPLHERVLYYYYYIDMNHSFLLFLIIVLSLMVVSMYMTIQRMQDAYHNITSQKQTEQRVCPPCHVVVCPTQNEPTSRFIDRDRAANSDPLYPPLNRMPRRDIPEDTFRFVGYLINEHDKEDTWKLFGREKRRHQGDWYVTTADKTRDIKIAITQDMMVKERLKDIWDIPDQITIQHPLFSSTPYRIIVNPNAELGSTMIYH